jgi:hypothetical protein
MWCQAAGKSSSSTPGETGAASVTTSIGITFRVRNARMNNPTGGRGVPASREQDVDDLAVLVDRPVDVPPPAVDLHVCLIHEPTLTR